jgi:predicted dehydrogenase
MVGLGVMGQNHLRVLGSLGAFDVSVAAAVDPDRDRRNAALRGLIDCRGYDSLDEALAAEELDFACIAAPVEHLAVAAAAALRAGLHVLVEKPMASSLSEARELLALADTLPQVLMVGLVERCNPAIRALMERLAAGQAGQIMQMHARRLSPFPNRSAMAGVALDLVTHDVDVMRYLSGSEVCRVFAETVAGAGGATEDLVCATMRFENGTTGVVESNWITPTKVRQLTVTGDRGMFVVDYLSQDLTFYEHPTKATKWEPLAGMRGGGEGNMIRYAIERWEPLRVEWESFLTAIRTGRPPLARGEDGYAALSIADAIRASGTRHEVAAPTRLEVEIA